MFRQTGGSLALDEATYLDQERFTPRKTTQIVVHGVLDEDRAQVTWALTQAQEGNRYSMQVITEEELTPLV